MDREPTKTAARKALRQRGIPPGACCGFCGEGALECLREVCDPELARHLARVLLDEHHPVGRAHDSERTIWLCRNHHALSTESQRLAGTPMAPQSNPLDREIARLKGWGSFYRDAADASDQMADELEEFAAFLDDSCPDWRTRWRNRK